MTQIVTIFREDAAYIASDSLWNCAALGRPNFVFRKVYAFGDHILASSGHGAAAQMLLDVRHHMPELSGAENHRDVGDALAGLWAEYARSYREAIKSSGAPQSFFIATRSGAGFVFTEWFGPPGANVEPFTHKSVPGSFYCFGPLALHPSEALDGGIYRRHALQFVSSALRPGALSGADVARCIDAAIHASVAVASARGGWEATSIGLPMTGWRLPVTGAANPIGNPEVGGLEKDAAGSLIRLLEPKQAP